MVDVVSDLLGIGTDAAYRRIRGSKLLDFEETVLLSRHFNISLDSVAGIQGKQFLCDYATLDFTDLKSYLTFAQFLENFVDNLRRMPESEIINKVFQKLGKG